MRLPFTSPGQAYRLTGRGEEAIAAQQRVLTQDPNFWGAYYELAVLYSEGGEEARAAREATTLGRRNPEVSLVALKQVLPYKDPAEVERVLAALRKAGLQ